MLLLSCDYCHMLMGIAESIAVANTRIWCSEECHIKHTEEESV
jgi:hypothetical protein